MDDSDIIKKKPILLELWLMKNNQPKPFRFFNTWLRVLDILQGNNSRVLLSFDLGWLGLIDLTWACFILQTPNGLGPWPISGCHETSGKCKPYYHVKVSVEENNLILNIWGKKDRVSRWRSWYIKKSNTTILLV